MKEISIPADSFVKGDRLEITSERFSVCNDVDCKSLMKITIGENCFTSMTYMRIRGHHTKLN